MALDLKAILKRLEKEGDPESVKWMAKYGIVSEKVYGVKIPTLRALAKEIGKDRGLARKLWDEGSRETRILASMVEDPKEVSEKQMEDWVKDFDCWEVCDQVIMNLFGYNRLAHDKAVEWSKREAEFEKRAGFALMAKLAVSDKKAGDRRFEHFFPHIKRGAKDERNFVKKAVSWALRQIGKRNLSLNKKAIRLGKDIRKLDSKAARWVGSDVLRELESSKVRERLKARARKG
jgi:3-methyladenine DNA glycosylase AlkD